jgi:Fe2+ transport system protein FeoA
LERISEELELDDEMLGFLYSSGFHPKADVELVGRDPKGAYTVSVGGKRVGVGEFAADRLFVAA